MSTKALLKANVLKGKSSEQLRAFLAAAIPPFPTPRDAKAWAAEAKRRRADALANVYLRGHSRENIAGKVRVAWGQTLRPHPSYSIRKLLIAIHENYFVPALLYVPAKPGAKVPVMLNVYGHGSGGKASEDIQARCVNLARRGVYALNLEFIGQGELMADRYHDQQNCLSFTGLSGVGMFYLALKRGLDVLLDLPRADRKRVGVTGLSGGGWQTIVIGALDERVTLIVPNAGYTTMKRRIECNNDLGDSEQTPHDMITALDYDHMSAMLAPRPTLQLMNANDECCFRTDRIKSVVYDAMLPVWKLMGGEGNLAYHSNTDPGTHNYGPDHRTQLYKFLNKHWALSGSEVDIHDPADVLGEYQVNVGLPKQHKSLMSIARDRADEIHRNRRAAVTLAQKEKLRERLAQVLRLPDYTMPALGVELTKAKNLSVEMGPVHVPMTIVPGKETGEVELVLTDRGRAAADASPSKYPRVHADIFGTGENQTSYLLKLVLESVGLRTLGVMTAQTIAIAESLSQGSRVVHGFASGVQPGVALCLAAALAPRHFASVTAQDVPPSLKYLLDWPMSFPEMQAVLCFGLFEAADVCDLIGLMEGVEYRAPGRRLNPIMGG